MSTHRIVLQHVSPDDAGIMAIWHRSCQTVTTLNQHAIALAIIVNEAIGHCKVYLGSEG